MPSILNLPANYDDIRAIMGVDSTQVSNTTLAYTTYEPDAEDWAMNKVPTWAVLTGADLNNLKRAIMYYTAYKTVDYLTLNIYDSEKLGDYDYKRNRQLDWQAAGQRWFKEAYRYLSYIAARQALDTSVSGIKLMGPSRAGTHP